MTPERHRRAGQLYHEALQRPREQRSSFLSSACQDDLALQHEVESLLRYAAHAHATIDASALEVLGRTVAVRQSSSWVGRQVSHYHIVSLLGRGGMGEVYRARDDRLGRDVAIKALPFVYSADATRLHRFEQEARAAGQLNHPNVVTVYDIGVHDGVPFIVAELLDGQELRQHLDGGALPLGRAIDYAQQIARGLEATHAKGIVHRDLKPENLFVTSDGRVKILDFGLAKLTAPPAGDVGAREASQRLGTVPGLVVGTIGYLSPEQLCGKHADHRADLFAFGVILYEMLTGRRPFERESPVETMTAMLKEEPGDLSEARPAPPPVLVRIVHRCLEKHPEGRFQSASDLGFALETLAPSPPLASGAHGAIGTSAGRAVRTRPGWALGAGLLVLLLGALAGGAVAWNRGATDPRPSSPVARFVLPVEASVILPGDLQLSPDGAYLAYSTGAQGARTLYLRDVARADAAPLAVFEGGEGPFFSPDSQWLGFFAYGKMRKVSVRGGTPIALADAPSHRGASWGEHGTIVFAPLGRAGLLRVSENGGAAEVLTTVDPERMETSHVRPQWLPGGKAIVYVARGETQANRSLMAYSLEDRTHRLLYEGADHPRYVPTGHLVYLYEGALMAAPFDLVRLELTGTPAPVIEGIASYGFSNAGLLMTAPRLSSAASRARLVWVNRQGAAEPLSAPSRNYGNPRVSPDGRRIAVDIQAGADSNVWIFDLAREALIRLTFEGRNLWPVWTHDGRRVIYGSNRVRTSWDIYWKPADGTGDEEPLLVKPLLQLPHSLSGDGALLGLTEFSPTAFETSLLSMDDRSVSTRLSGASSPSLSHDGRWIAYASSLAPSGTGSATESDGYQIYVRPTSGAAGPWQISTDGGVEPLWSASGSELFYRNRDQLLAVDVVTQSGFEYGRPRVLFEGAYRLNGLDSRNYDVTPDGQRFLMIEDETEAVTSHLDVVLNWFVDLERILSPN